MKKAPCYKLGCPTACSLPGPPCALIQVGSQPSTEKPLALQLNSVFFHQDSNSSPGQHGDKHRYTDRWSWALCVRIFVCAEVTESHSGGWARFHVGHLCVITNRICLKFKENIFRNSRKGVKGIVFSVPYSLPDKPSSFKEDGTGGRFHYFIFYFFLKHSNF